MPHHHQRHHSRGHHHHPLAYQTFPADLRCAAYLRRGAREYSGIVGSSVHHDHARPVRIRWIMAGDTLKFAATVDMGWPTSNNSIIALTSIAVSFCSRLLTGR
jgi:hypothetical protein